MTTDEVSLISLSYAREVICFITYQLVVALAKGEHWSSDSILCMSHCDFVKLLYFGRIAAWCPDFEIACNMSISWHVMDILSQDWLRRISQAVSNCCHPQELPLVCLWCLIMKICSCNWSTSILNNIESAEVHGIGLNLQSSTSNRHPIKRDLQEHI